MDHQDLNDMIQTDRELHRMIEEQQRTIKKMNAVIGQQDQRIRALEDWTRAADNKKHDKLTRGAGMP